MLDLKYIISNLEVVKEKTKNRNYDFDFDLLISENNKRKNIINEVEKLKADRNAISKQVGILKREGKDTTELQEQVKRDASKMQELDEALSKCDENIRNMLLNLPHGEPCRILGRHGGVKLVPDQVSPVFPHGKPGLVGLFHFLGRADLALDVAIPFSNSFPEKGSLPLCRFHPRCQPQRRIHFHYPRMLRFLHT